MVYGYFWLFGYIFPATPMEHAQIYYQVTPLFQDFSDVFTGLVYLDLLFTGRIDSDLAFMASFFSHPKALIRHIPYFLTLFN